MILQGFDRINSYIRSLISDTDEKLHAIYEEAVINGVPVIRPEAREFMRIQLLMKKPQKILEIGTAVGYSSIFMLSVLQKESMVTTLELDSERIAKAKSNISMMGMTDRITILEGDALDTLKTLPSDEYDFIFVDAAKAQYINYITDVKRTARKNALIITDNVFMEGDVLESHFLVEKRNRTIHDRMREYLYAITHDDELTTAVLSVGDGMAVSIKG